MNAGNLLDATGQYALGVRCGWYDLQHGTCAALVGDERYDFHLLPRTQWWLDGYQDLTTAPDPGAYFVRVLGVSPPAFRRTDR